MDLALPFFVNYPKPEHCPGLADLCQMIPTKHQKMISTDDHDLCHSCALITSQTIQQNW